MNVSNQAQSAYDLLRELHALLVAQGETNWRRGIEAAIGELALADGAVNVSGFENARSVYNTMTSGGRGFAEYAIWIDDDDARIDANRKLDQLRTDIWSIFNS